MKYKIDTSKGEIAKEVVILAKTRVFMNESGKALDGFTAKQTLRETIIFHDDLDLTVGNFKISFGVGSAGHKGVISIINHARSKDFWRVRIGISPKKKIKGHEKVRRYVLGNFTKKEKDTLLKLFPRIEKEVVEILMGREAPS